jgi:hypothetical protein
LTRIESNAFSFSSLESIVIPRNVRFIDGSAFIRVPLSSISIESGNEIFVIENDLLIDVLHHKLIRNFSRSSTIEIGRNVEILGSHCFSSCFSLSSITFESNSHLTRIESSAFHESQLPYILIPSFIFFIASDAVDFTSQIRLVEAYSCPEFDRWLELKRSGIAIDFRRLSRVGFDIPSLGDYIVNLSGFEERSIHCKPGEIANQIYDRIEDEFSVLMKSAPHSDKVEQSAIEEEIEKMVNVRHYCIIAPIGFAFRIESGIRQELKIVRLYFEGLSLIEVISMNPPWWTSTVKAKAIAGIVLGLRFAHSLRLVHGHLTGHNILFDSDHCIEIVDFHGSLLKKDKNESGREGEGEKVTQLRSFSVKGWTGERDIQAFASILFEVLFGHPPQGETSIPTGIPSFVSEILKSGLSPMSGSQCSYNTLLDILKENNFAIEEGVDSEEVSAFVRWIESTEYPGE